jgi:hypothetical protein
VPGFNLNPNGGDNCGPVVLTNNLTGNNTLGGTSLPVGSTTVIWTMTDAAGNNASCSVTYVVTDNEDPNAYCIEQINAVLDANGQFQVTQAMVDLGSTDNCAIADIGISRDGVNFGETLFVNCADALNSPVEVILQVTDIYGNVSQCTTDVFVYDLDPPVLTCPNPVTVNTDAGVCTAIVNGIGLQYQFDNCPVTVTYEITGATTGSGTGDASGTVFNKGISTVTYTITDESGNSSLCFFDVTVKDKEAPVLNCANLGTQIRSTNAGECSYTAVGSEFDPASFGDNCPGTTISNNYNNSSTLAGAEFPKGTTIVIWTATDASGNATTCSVKITINDNELPTITCPVNQTLNNDPGQCSKVILTTVLNPSFSDNCPDATISHNYLTAPNPWTLAGASFPVGSTLVTWTVKDASNNTATCAFTVTVKDVEKPEFIGCPTDTIMVGNDVDKCWAKVNWPIPLAEDNCDVLSILQIGGPPNGSTINVSTFPVTVTYRAMDVNGNSALCSFKVLVMDTQNPEFDADIVMPTNITVECDAIPTNCVFKGNGPNFICAPLTNDDVHDNCTASQDLVITFTQDSTQCADPSQCCYYNYTLTRTWKVTDAAGNMLVHTQVITVNDTTAPEAQCQDVTVTLDKFGSATVTPAQVNNGSTDNCAAPEFLTYTLDKSTFGCNDIGTNTVTLTVTDPCGNSSTCTATVTVLEGIGNCTPEYDLANSVKCECLNNATTLENGQFYEVIQIHALAGQTWTLTANTGLFSSTSPAPPAAPVALPLGLALVPGSNDGLDNDGDGTTDEADEMVFYTLKGIHVDGKGYTVTVKNAAGQSLTISNKCYYPTPIFTNLDDPFCLYTAPFVIQVGENYGASGTVTSLTVNGVATNIFDAAALGAGSHKIVATFDAGDAQPFITVNGVTVEGSEAEALADPGCQQMIMQFVQVVGTPSTVVCNDLIHISLDTTCEKVVTPDDVLEGTYYCFDDYTVIITYPPGTTQFNPPNQVDATHINKTLTYVLTHSVSGNLCWGEILVEDKLAPVLACPADTSVLCVEDPNDFDLTGAATADDCSPYTIQSQDTLTEFSCAENTLVKLRIRRAFIASDIWGNVSQCVQEINVLRGELDLVTFPADKSYTCASAPASLHPSFTGWPEVAGVSLPGTGTSNCGMGASFNDDIVYECPGSYYIVRTWKVFDFCPAAGGLPTSIEHVQFINVSDLPPTITLPPATYIPDSNLYIVPVDFGKCVATSVPLATVEDACNNILSVSVLTPNGGTTNGGLIPAPGLPVGKYTLTYTAIDSCGGVTNLTINIKVVDNQPPSVACDEFTQVAVTTGSVIINAGTFDDGTTDNCCLDHFEVQRMNGQCDGTPDDFGPTVEFCCSDIGDTVAVVLRAYDCHNNYNECMVQVFVEDKLDPICTAPANVTVSCEAFDPSLWAYGTADAVDNCCLDTIITTANYNLFDTLCNRGTITRTFRAFDCFGNSSQCTQRVIVTYEQDYYVKFPNDVIVTNCDGTGNFGQPEFFGKDCELMATSYTDAVFTTVPDACMMIERTWTISNWCTYNPDAGCTYVPNPNPNTNTQSTQNLPGPIVSPFGTPAPWAPTVIAVSPGAPPTNYSTFWSANANCYQYKQIIKIVDSEDPIVSNCPDSTVQYCDLSVNDTLLWNEPYWWDETHDQHDLCEGDAPLSITATDSCSGSYLNVSFLLFLDTDGNGTMETVINSNNPPAPGTVNFDNLNTPNFGGGQAQVFDGRPVPANEVYRWAVHQVNTGLVQTASVQWKTLAQMPSPNNPLGLAGVAPQLPHGLHKIKWIVSDGCGNETTCEYEFEVKDCKAPTIVCHDGIAVNIMPTDMIQLWDVDFLQYAEDNCTPPTPFSDGPNQLVFSVRKAGTGTGFPVDAQGNPISSVIFDCSELGPQEVELWAMDLAGNADYCVATVDVQDNAGHCSNDQLSVAGALMTELDEGVEDANVYIQGTPPNNAAPVNQFVMTDDQGAFMFANVLPLGSDYTLTPTKDDNPLNGVSTYDLVLISKHILGLQPLGSPYKMIAADANKNNSITTFDIVEIRKLILGIYTELPNNTSWRFVDSDYAFPMPDNPWFEQFPETKSVADIQTHQLDDDFVGVKIGDVNNSVIPNSFVLTDDRSDGALFFDVEDRKVKSGETFTVTFRAAEKVQGYQFTMNFSGLELLDVLPGEHMSAGNFGIFTDALTTSFDVPPSAAAPAEFSVRFRSRKAGKLSEMLSVSSRVTRAEAYKVIQGNYGHSTNSDNDLNDANDAMTNDLMTKLDVAFRFNSGKGSVVSNVGFELYQNQPNPFVNKTVIGFHLPEAAEATLTVHDEMGRILFTQKGQFAKGYNAIPLERALLNTVGLMYYTLETDTDTATRKMIQTK